MSGPFTGLDPHVAKLMLKAVARRDMAGTNVYFTRADGTPDRFSFASESSAARFSASLERQGIKAHRTAPAGVEQ